MSGRRRNWTHAYMAVPLIVPVVLLILLLCSGCRTRYVPVESVRTEYRDRDVERTVTDTVRDTRFVLVKGDTVIDWRDRWRTVREYVHDTCHVERRDSISYPVERQLTRWERAKMDFGGMATGGVIIALCVAVAWLIKKFRKQ